MNERDRKKIMAAGFILYRCSESEKLVKKRTLQDLSWKIESRAETKKAIRLRHLQLLDDPKAIQD